MHLTHTIKREKEFSIFLLLLQVSCICTLPLHQWFALLVNMAHGDFQVGDTWFVDLNHVGPYYKVMAIRSILPFEMANNFEARKRKKK